MNIPIRYLVILSIASAAAGAYFYNYVRPVQGIITSIEERGKIVTVIKEVVRSDGTKEVDTRIVQDTVSKTNKTEVLPKNWFVAVGSSFSSLAPIYTLQVNRRILGPVYIGASVSTDKSLSGWVGFEF